MKKIIILFLSLFVLVSCSKDDDNEASKKSGATTITAFTFTATDNEALTEDVKAEIDENQKTINAKVPSGTNVKTLKPSITLSENATVDPKEKTAVDFSDDVIYTVTGEDGSTAKYTVAVTVEKSDAKQITSFVFLAADNDALSDDLSASIDTEARTIAITVSTEVDVTALIPTISISEKATIDPKEKVLTDFSSAITYTVTAEDDTKVEYTAAVTRPLTEREALVGIYNANPNNTLGWDLEEANIATWRGVTLDDNGKLVKLDIDGVGLDNLPATIGYLTNLENLSLKKNSLTLLPPEIGNLTSLQILDLDENSLTSLPPEIGNLTSLVDLSLFKNSLTSLPSEIGNLTNLVDLSASGNSLTSIPSEIGNLTNLVLLFLTENSLTSLPPEMGKLTKLAIFWVANNQIMIIPREICALNIGTFLKDSTAECEQ
ncbi:hypothetical protein KIM67_10550 [Flagellimonas sp. 389]|uniref:leucine-rich repeat domain-containing protein n=1 Tax=Flagellimonas sp. 389 TaxID=2835862 RepID=UPI001BD6CAEB|nr:DUF5018 domain-containing protein [Flagellimonas sp. 389]MBS9462852.1 hypothetical protein [Flagellimonas sp. 389]